MAKKWDRSRKKTLRQENKSPSDTTKIKWMSITNIKSGRYPNTLGLKIINTGNKQLRPIRKFKKLARMQERGINSLGNMPCFNIEELAMKELVASVKALVGANTSTKIKNG